MYISISIYVLHIYIDIYLCFLSIDILLAICYNLIKRWGKGKALRAGQKTGRKEDHMTMQEYYKLVADRWEKIDKDNLESLHCFNEWKRMLRKLVDED